MYPRLLIIVALLAAGVLIYYWKTGLNQSTAVSIDDLKFPVTVVFSTASSYVHHDEKDLSTMSMQAVVMHETPPHLIDNELNLFQLQELKSTKGSMQLMLSAGNGLTPVTFKLKPIRDDSHVQARQLLASLIASDLSDEEVRGLAKRIQTARTLEEILDTE